MGDARQAVHLVAATVGFASLGLLWLSVLWGSTLRIGWGFTRIRYSTLHIVHQTATMTGLTLGVVHALAQLAVPGGPVRLLDEWLPFANRTDPIGVGFAVIALELMLALVISVPLQRRLGHHRWRRLHSLAYLAYTLLTAHVLISGSDLRPWLMLLIGAGWAGTVALRLVTSARMAALARRVTDAVLDRLRGRQVTVQVEPARCARLGFCEQEAPAVFRLDGDGRLGYRPSVPQDQVEAVLAALRACPVRAITLGRLPTTVHLPGSRPTPSAVPDAGAPADRTAPGKPPAAKPRADTTRADRTRADRTRADNSRADRTRADRDAGTGTGATPPVRRHLRDVGGVR